MEGIEVKEIPEKVIELSGISEKNEIVETKDVSETAGTNDGKLSVLQGKVTGSVDLPQTGINTIGTTNTLYVSGMIFIICLFFFVRGRLKNE